MSDVNAPADELRVIVRPLPKVVFFYLTWIASFAIALWPGELGGTAGLIWMAVFFFNTLVISFDFDEVRSVAFLLGGIATFFALLAFGWLGFVTSILEDLNPVMNRTFYWLMFGLFSLLYAFVWLRTRFDYWEFMPNEVRHRYGVFQKIKRYSTDSLRWDKSVPDMLERMLLASGRIVLTTPHETHPVIIEHVVRIGSVDDQIANILGVRRVVSTTLPSATTPPPPPPPAPNPPAA